MPLERPRPAGAAGRQQRGRVAGPRVASLCARAACVALIAPPSRRQASIESFLEELVVRRELADNYCHHCPGGCLRKGAPPWAADAHCMAEAGMGSGCSSGALTARPATPFAPRSRFGILRTPPLRTPPLRTPPLRKPPTFSPLPPTATRDPQHQTRTTPWMPATSGRARRWRRTRATSGSTYTRGSSWRPGARTTSCGTRRSGRWCGGGAGGSEAGSAGRV
jgi:hypothetical protein